jgi:hypothetical protein
MSKCHWTKYAEFCTKRANDWQRDLDNKSIPVRHRDEVSKRIVELRESAAEALEYSELRAFDIATRLQDSALAVTS